MGEVYRARDTKLEREVAIKVLPEEFARDQERLARFEREAKLLASLNHPNIATIHGFEDVDGIKALVLELVEGPTLAERIAEGAIPLEEALPMARQMAQALEAGHEAGVIHRDLKPANVKLREDGTVKVLDYGLAKAFEGEPTDTDAELSQSPTLTRHGTQVGVILGTASYMSPEQAKGERVDKRTDIFAFGAVLFEMLTGKKAFPGDDVSEILVAVIRAEPDWSLLPAIPANVDGLLRRCLYKDATRRLRDIGEARLTLEGTTDLDAVEVPERRRGALTWAASALVLGILVGVIATRWPTPGASSSAAPVVRFDIAVPETSGGHLASILAMTPDGSQLVFVRTVGGVQQLFRRAMGEQELVAIRGTEGGTEPFLSPNGEWVGFHADGKLKKVRLQGGPSAVLCDAPHLLGASWGDNDKIVFAREGRLWDVSGAGGTPRPLTGAEEGDPIPAGRTCFPAPRRCCSARELARILGWRSFPSRPARNGCSSTVPIHGLPLQDTCSLCVMRRSGRFLSTSIRWS